MKAMRRLSLWLLPLLSGCGGREQTVPAPARRITGVIPQSAYVWQRDWNEAVRAAVKEHGRDFRSLAVLGAQLSGGNAVRPRIDWPSLAAAGSATAAVIRLEKPLPANPAEAVVAEAR